MSGYVAMSRQWHDHDFFEGDEFSRRDAWSWMIAQAAWKPTTTRIKGAKVELQRGELCFSQRFLAEKWGWSKSRVDRFITNLRDEGMIETRSKIGATAGHPAGQGQSIISICNYDKYQMNTKAERGNEQNEIGATAGQQRGKEEPSNQETIEPKNEITARRAASYAFEGSVVRLTHEAFDKWAESFPDIDLRARLQSRDDWLANDATDKDRERWFMSTSNWLAKIQQQAAMERREEEAPAAWDGMP